MKAMYLSLIKVGQKVNWRELFYNNVARPKASVILWLTCHERLVIRGRLHRFGMVDYNICSFCSKKEIMHHLFFECDNLKNIWNNILKWIQVHHDLGGW